MHCFCPFFSVWRQEKERKYLSSLAQKFLAILDSIPEAGKPIIYFCSVLSILLLLLLLCWRCCLSVMLVAGQWVREPLKRFQTSKYVVSVTWSSEIFRVVPFAIANQPSMYRFTHCCFQRHPIVPSYCNWLLGTGLWK